MICLAELWIYPVKALCGMRVDTAEVDSFGLVGDRRFMIVDGQNQFVTQRNWPSLAGVRATLSTATLELAVGDAVVTVPSEVEGAPRDVWVWGREVAAVDASAPASELLSEHLGFAVRLVRMHESARRPADPEHARAGDLIAFHDGFPFLLTHDASLDALNSRLEHAVDMRRFRPNLVVEGGEAFVEDSWRTIEIGEMTFHARKACGRCSVVDVDPDRGERDSAVLGELARFRKVGGSINFGQNLVHDGQGTLRVGAPVTA